MRIKTGGRPDNFVAKVILSADPSVSPNDFYVAAIYEDQHELALLKFGEKSWRYIQEYPRRQRHLRVPGTDMIFHRVPQEPILPYPNQIICYTDIDQGDVQYLVESSQGDLLLVQRIHDNGFQVYKVILPNQASNNNIGRVELEKLASLGGDALFIGDNHSMAIPATKRPPGCKPDTVYFSSGCVEWYFTLDIGVYNIKDGSFDMHYQQELKQQNMPPPIYIIPPPYFTSFIHNFTYSYKYNFNTE
ncbi:hypothetical protein LIER_19743 [Lithospermum erythrorhizon]|uniref:KIB1-4 beta-propeller domain-containing protein n=1 Tax=Lithospermum erythrorhizon TaxID=34254 RepID=A0AAV3QLW3_LITER